MRLKRVGWAPLKPAGGPWVQEPCSPTVSLSGNRIGTRSGPDHVRRRCCAVPLHPASEAGQTLQAGEGSVSPWCPGSGPPRRVLCGVHTSLPWAWTLNAMGRRRWHRSPLRAIPHAQAFGDGVPRLWWPQGWGTLSAGEQEEANLTQKHAQVVWLLLQGRDALVCPAVAPSGGPGEGMGWRWVLTGGESLA